MAKRHTHRCTARSTREQVVAGVTRRHIRPRRHRHIVWVAEIRPTTCHSRTKPPATEAANRGRLKLRLDNHRNDRGLRPPPHLILHLRRHPFRQIKSTLLLGFTHHHSSLHQRPSSRSDIMGLYMPPHIFRLTNFRVPPKVEIGPDGKPRLVCESAGEEAEPVDCKVEDEMYPMPASQTWTSNTVEQSFAGSSLYPVGSRWQAQSEANTNLRPEVTWPSSSSTLGSSHSGLRRREGNMGQEGWPSHHTQSQPSRWQDSAAATSGAGPGGLYLERSRARTSHHPYEETVVLPRREHEALPSFNRYSSSGSRENASHRVQWHHRDTHHGKERRMSPHSPSSFTSSPTLPFSPHATYHPSHFSSAWTSSDSHAMDTPTLHPISPSAYETSYTSPSLSSPEDFGNVEEFTEA